MFYNKSDQGKAQNDVRISSDCIALSCRPSYPGSCKIRSLCRNCQTNKIFTDIRKQQKSLPNLSNNLVSVAIVVHRVAETLWHQLRTSLATPSMATVEIDSFDFEDAGGSGCEPGSTDGPASAPKQRASKGLGKGKRKKPDSEATTITGGSRSAGTSSGRSTLSETLHAKKAGKCELKACDAPKVGKHKWCGVHRRAFDILHGIAFQGNDAAAFITVFGDRKEPGDADLQEVVMRDFLMQNPDLLDESTLGQRDHCRKKRKLNQPLSRYTHTTGVESSTEQNDVRPWADWELFKKQMANLRDWSKEQAIAEWEKLKTNAGEKDKDYNGPPYAPLRLKLPVWMFGLDNETNKRKSFESKQLETATKQTAMDTEQKKQIINELNQGFSSRDALPSLPQSSDGLQRRLPSDSFTFDGGEQYSGGAELIRTAAGVAGPDSGPELQPALASPKKDAPAGSMGTMPNAVGQKKQLCDVASVRSSVHRTLRPMLTQSMEKLGKELRPAGSVLLLGNMSDAHGMWPTLLKRWQVGHTFFGTEPAKDELGEQFTFDGRANQIEFEIKGDTEVAQANTQRLRDELLALDVLPIEDPETFLCKKEALAILASVRSLTKAEDVENAKITLEAVCESLDQLASSIKTATKDVQKENKQAASDKAKRDKEALEKQEKDALEAKCEEEELAKIRLTHESRTKHFNIDWKAAGHPEIMTVNGDAELAEAWQVRRDTLASSPFIFVGSTALKGALSPDGDAGKALAAFGKHYPSAKGIDRSGRIVAPIKERHAPVTFKKAFAPLVPEEHQVLKMKEGSGAEPELKLLEEGIPKQMFFYGIKENTVAHDFENDALAHYGSIRIQVAGESQILAVSAQHLFLLGDKPTDQKAKDAKQLKDDLLKCVSKLDSMGDDVAKNLLTKGVNICHGKLSGSPDSPAVLVLPAGYVLCVASPGLCHGVRKPVLVSTKSTHANLSVLWKTGLDALLGPVIDSLVQP